jgi:CheY-like chemotaxis protein
MAEAEHFEFAKYGRKEFENDLLSEVVDSWHSRLPEGFCLRLQPAPDCCEIGCDSTRIKQILNNLIDNAIKYSPDGGTICVSTLANSDEVQVSVSDRGIGISPEGVEKIFDRFQQLESGFTRRAGGLGIGLCLARDLIELQGGRIWVESEQGEGSTFTFTLPKIPATTQESNEPISETEGNAEPGNPWDDRTILIVDDLEHYHEYMRLLMASAPRMLSAYNGLEAIDAVRRESPDLILMDLRMPIMDGFDAIEHLKSDPITKDIPIVAVTAQAMDDDKARSAQMGADGFVTKPIDIPVFKTELWRVLGVLA